MSDDIKIVGKDEDGNVMTFRFGQPLPPDVKANWDNLIAAGREVGLPWWGAIPSYTNPVGFVAAAIASLYVVTSVEGFTVPPPPPDSYPL